MRIKKRRVEVNDIVYEYRAGAMFTAIYTAAAGRQWGEIPEHARVDFSIQTPAGREAEITEAVEKAIRQTTARQRRKARAKVKA